MSKNRYNRHTGGRCGEKGGAEDLGRMGTAFSETGTLGLGLELGCHGELVGGHICTAPQGSGQHSGQPLLDARGKL